MRPCRIFYSSPLYYFIQILLYGFKNKNAIIVYRVCYLLTNKVDLMKEKVKISIFFTIFNIYIFSAGCRFNHVVFGITWSTFFHSQRGYYFFLKLLQVPSLGNMVNNKTLLFYLFFTYWLLSFHKIFQVVFTPGQQDKCFLCGQMGHFAADCQGKAKRKVGEFDEKGNTDIPKKPFQVLFKSFCYY